METHLPILLDKDEGGHMCVSVRSGVYGCGGDTIRTCCRLGTGIDVGVEEDAIFVEAILELEGRDSIV